MTNLCESIVLLMRARGSLVYLFVSMMPYQGGKKLQVKEQNYMKMREDIKLT